MAELAVLAYRQWRLERRMFWRNPTAAFFGTWVFCFWAGEMVQMLSGDLITYWRVLPLYFWALGVAISHEHSVR